MDLISLWTAPFPMDSTLSTVLDVPELVFDSQKDSSSPDSLDDLQNLPTGIIATSDAFALTPGNDHTEPTIHEQSEKLSGRRKPMPRKGHKKSRRGCYGCKRRKIKCSELKPHCENCTKAGISCEYPMATEQALVISPGPSLQSSPTMFTMNDMRFFHHFIVRAYPHLPVGADRTWTMEIPAIAHEYDFLMKAMLAHGASHLDLTTTDELGSQGLKHRVDAITMLNKALARPALSKEEYDARFATFMILTFQSTCLEDGLADFLTMLRGCVLNGNFLQGSYFRPIELDSHLEAMDDVLKEVDLSTLDAVTLSDALASLAQLEPLCESDTEKKYHSILTDVAVGGYKAPAEAYQAFVMLYNIVGSIPSGAFQALIDPTRPVSQLLLSHFLAAHILLRHVAVHEMMSNRGVRDPNPMYSIMLNWMSRIDSNLPPEYRKYNDWPRRYVSEWSPMIAAGGWVHSIKEGSQKLLLADTMNSRFYRKV